MTHQGNPTRDLGAVADELGFDFKSKSANIEADRVLFAKRLSNQVEITGTYRGFPARVFTTSDFVYAQEEEHHTHYELTIPDLELGLSLNTLSYLEHKAIGYELEEGQTCDEHYFETEAWSNAAKREDVLAYFTARRRAAMVDFLTQKRGSEITDTHVGYYGIGVPTLALVVTNALDALIKVADVLLSTDKEKVARGLLPPPLPPL